MSEKGKYSLLDAGNIQFKLTCGISLLGAVHEVIEHGNNAAEEYTDALFGVYDYLWTLNKELRQCIDGCCDDGKASGKAHKEVAA